MPRSTKYGFLMVWCLFGTYAGVVNSLWAGCDPRHCGIIAQEVGRLLAGASSPLFLAAAWILWKRSTHIKNYGTIAFIFAMLFSMTQVAIGFAAIRPPEMLATVAFALGMAIVFAYFVWLWAGVARERFA